MGQTERFTLGNGMVSSLEYDPETHLLAAIRTKIEGLDVQNLLLDYDGFCNLAARKDNLRNMEERFTYTDTYARPVFDRGFTGHEHLYAFGLINMNGRMYDPVMSSFLSPDRYIQDPTTAQGFNRYAYCMYNPLRFVDPTGWAPRPGGGHGPDDPPPYVTMYGYSGYQLEDVVVTASPIDNHEFEYTPYYSTGGGGDLQWGMSDNYQSNNYGSGGGGGNHGTSTTISQLSPIPFNGNSISLVDNCINNVLETDYYINGTSAVVKDAAEFTKSTLEISKKAEAAKVLGKVTRVSKVIGSVGLLVNVSCIGIQVEQNMMPWQEGVVRSSMSVIEFAVAGIPYVGPIISIGLTAYDIGGGFDNNLYKTENWWK